MVGLSLEVILSCMLAREGRGTKKEIELQVTKYTLKIRGVAC